MHKNWKTMVAQNLDLVGEGKTFNSWMCPSYPFRHNTKLHCAEGKAKVYGEWAQQNLKSLILYVFIVFVFTTNLIPSILHDFFYSIHFDKLSLRNR